MTDQDTEALVERVSRALDPAAWIGGDAFKQRRLTSLADAKEALAALDLPGRDKAVLEALYKWHEEEAKWAETIRTKSNDQGVIDFQEGRRKAHRASQSLIRARGEQGDG